jgi:hypothetical protein
MTPNLELVSPRLTREANDQHFVTTHVKNAASNDNAKTTRVNNVHPPNIFSMNVMVKTKIPVFYFF